MKLGMLIPEFPTQTHIFFWREIHALRSEVEVFPISTRRPSEGCPHDFGPSAAAETHYVYPPGAGALRVLVSNPRGLRRAVEYVRSLSERGPRRLRAAGFLACAADLARYARRVGLDHIHTHSCADAAHIVAIARLLGGPPYSLHLHGDLAVYGVDHQQKSRLANFVAAAAKPMERQLANELGLPPERTCTLTMGVDTTRFRPRDPQTPPGRVQDLVTVARLVLGKGHRYALAAVRTAVDRGAELRYAIVGSGPDRSEIAREIAALCLGDRVRLLGSLGEQEVLEQLQQADVFVLPSVGRFEASPVSVMEAMACGLPVVASRVGGIADMITDGIDGFLVGPEDVAGLAAAIERLWRDPALRQRVGEAARRRAVESFDSRARARQLVEVIRSSASAGPERLVVAARGKR
jgi:glycosyltransferase involved in cell wall biosynthesis